MRVILVDNGKDIDPATVNNLIDRLKTVEYHDYNFTSNISVGFKDISERHTSDSNLIYIGKK